MSLGPFLAVFTIAYVVAYVVDKIMSRISRWGEPATLGRRWLIILIVAIVVYGGAWPLGIDSRFALAFCGGINAILVTRMIKDSRESDSRQ